MLVPSYPIRADQVGDIEEIFCAVCKDPIEGNFLWPGAAEGRRLEECVADAWCESCYREYLEPFLREEKGEI